MVPNFHAANEFFYISFPDTSKTAKAAIKTLLTLNFLPQEANGRK